MPILDEGQELLATLPLVVLIVGLLFVIVYKGYLVKFASKCSKTTMEESCNVELSAQPGGHILTGTASVLERRTIVAPVPED